MQVGLPVLLIGAMAAIRYLPHSDSRTPQPGPEKKNQPIPVKVFIVKDEPLVSSIQAVGTLLPEEEVDLAVESAGKVTGIYFTEGEKVKKGDLLLKVNDADLQAQLQKTKAQQKLIEERLNRQRILFEKDAVSREEYDQVQTDFNVIEAEIVQLEAEIAKTEVHAPFSGTIGLRQVSPGAYLQSNTFIARLVDEQHLKIEFSIPEKYASLPLQSAEIKFHTEAFPREYTGIVYAIEPGIDTQTRTMQLRARCKNPSGELRSGMFARIDLITSETESALLIPTEAIVPEMDGKTVWKLMNGVPVSVPVETGERMEKLIEVTSGLMPGDTVLTSGLLQIRPGVNVVPETIE